MIVEWNKVTWYSKIAAVIVGLATIALGYYFYIEFRKVGEIVPVGVQFQTDLGFKTYDGSFENLVSFLYPSDLSISEGDSDAVFIHLQNSTHSDQFELIIHQNGGMRGNIDEFLKKTESLKEKELIIGGLHAIQVKENRTPGSDSPERQTSVVYVKADNYLYEIIDWRIAGNGDLNFQKLIDSIKFPVKTANTDWKTYQDESRSACAGKFSYPKEGDVLRIGDEVSVNWQMPSGDGVYTRVDDTYYTIGIDLIDVNNVSVGSIIDWNWVKYNPTRSAMWDSRTIYLGDIANLSTSTIKAGKYKLRLKYEYTDSPHKECPSKGEFETGYFEIKYSQFIK